MALVARLEETVGSMKEKDVVEEKFNNSRAAGAAESRERKSNLMGRPHYTQTRRLLS